MKLSMLHTILFEMMQNGSPQMQCIYGFFSYSLLTTVTIATYDRYHTINISYNL